LYVVVPGFFALRSIRRWKSGIPRPTFAFVLAAFGLLETAWLVYLAVNPPSEI